MQCHIGLENVVKRNSAAFALQSGQDFGEMSVLRTIIWRAMPHCLKDLELAIPEMSLRLSYFRGTASQ
jgi:hypothetical protein